MLLTWVLVDLGGWVGRVEVEQKTVKSRVTQS